MKHLKSIHIILLLFLVLTEQPTIYAQNNQNLDGYLQSILNIDYLPAISELKKTNNNDINSQAISLLEVLYKSGQIPHIPKEKIDLSSNVKAKIINLIQLGYYKLYYQPQEKNTLIYFIDAYNLSKSISNSSLKKLCLLSILEFYHFEYAQTHTRYLKYLEEFESLANTPIEKCWANLYTLYFLYQSIANFNQQKVDEAFLKLEINVKQIPITHNFHTLFNSIKAIKMEYSDDLANAYSTHKKVIKTSKGKPFFNFLIFRSYIRISEIHYKWKEYDKGIDAINHSINYIDKSNMTKDSIHINQYSSKHFAAKENFRMAYEYLTTSLEKQYLLDYKENNIQNSALEIELQTAEKEKQIIVEQQKKKQNRNIAFSLAGILILGGIIGFLIQRNTKRKQLLAEKGKALETQKLATVLKEQELKSIDAMIAGQEKERQRIANDLHDDLGSLMANVKLHFDALKDNPSPELYTKANSLIENAYDKIRGIAHAKNSGVMANKGLLKAINDIANSNSIANKLHIQVVDYGLEQQLENSLELTIFRIIQELIANIIKHAEATEATIHITNHDDAINLMIEDNGKGFDTKTISKQEGMGIHSIDKRIESLGGTITIESEISKGTTVIIDIPTL